MDEEKTIQQASLTAMPKRILLPAITFFTAIIAALLLFDREKGTLGRRDSDFIPFNASLIDRFIIFQGNDSVILEKTNSGWTVNKTLAANEELIELFKASLGRIEIVSPSSRAVRQQITEMLYKEGSVVQLYVNDRLKSTLYVKYDTSGIRGTYMMRKGSRVPFMVRLTGYAADDITGFFSPRLNSWRSNLLIDCLSDSISEVILEYPGEESESFRIRKESDGTLVLAGFDDHEVSPEQIDQQKIEDYLAFFAGIPCQYDGYSLPEGFFRQKPFALLQVEDLNGRRNEVTAYRLPSSSGNGVSYDMDRFIALTGNGPDTAMVYYSDMDPVFRRIDDFLKK